MKNITIIILFFGLTISACKKSLDLDPLSDISSKEFYSTTEEVELATIAIYDGLQLVPLREFAITEMRSDNTKSKSSEGDWAQFERFAVQPTNLAIGEYWKANYNVIFRANKVLENLDVVTIGNFKIQFEGEAKFNRALGHFNLVRAYGDIPLLDKVITATDSDYFDRDASADVYALIIQDLTDAMGLLPVKSDFNFGRATREAATGLLAKVFLTLGRHSEAEPLLASLIANPNLALEPNYNDVFYNEGNREIIFAIPYLDDDINESQDYSFEFTAGGVRSGLNYLTDDFINNMDGSDLERNSVLINPSNDEEVGKFLTASANARLCGNDWIVLRLADVYLMHTEAIMNGASATSNIDAITSYNAVRARVGLSEVPVDGTGEITLEMLLNERRMELAFENHRLYDLVRTGQAQTVLSNFADGEGYIFNSTSLLLPIPQGEINVSDGLLSQNPGY